MLILQGILERKTTEELKSLESDTSLTYRQRQFVKFELGYRAKN